MWLSRYVSATVPVLLMGRELGAGGTERQLTEVAKCLDRSRWTPHVACFRDGGIRAHELRAAGVPIVQLPVHSFLSPSVFSGARYLGRYLRDHGIRITHTFDMPTNIFGTVAARMQGCPVVLSSQRSYRSLRKPQERLLLRLTDRIVDGIVVNCEAMKRHLLEDEKIAADRVHVCLNGIDLARFPHEPRSRRPELASAETVIGTVCVLRPEKGLNTLIEAFARLGRQDVRLVIVGSGPVLADLQSLSRQLGVDPLFVPATADVGSWLRSMDIFVLPSLSEALSNALMEAMASGCCPVASRVGGNPELVQPGETGMLFEASHTGELAEVLERLTANPDLRRQFAESAVRLIMSRFTVAASVRRMGEIYTAMLDR